MQNTHGAPSALCLLSRMRILLPATCAHAQSKPHSASQEAPETIRLLVLKYVRALVHSCYSIKGNVRSLVPEFRADLEPPAAYALFTAVISHTFPVCNKVCPRNSTGTPT